LPAGVKGRGTVLLPAGVEEGRGTVLLPAGVEGK